jgi:hypothetical protein
VLLQHILQGAEQHRHNAGVAHQARQVMSSRAATLAAGLALHPAAAATSASCYGACVAALA